MAGPQAHHSPRHNFPPGGKDELARGVLTEASYIHTPIPAVSRAHTPAPALALSSINELLKQFIKLYLEA